MPAIRAVGLTKTFRLFHGPLDRFKARVGLIEPRLVNAVRDVTFDVSRGGAFGIVGENGAGKSTLLRMFAGITTPTSGACRVEGRIGEILGLGAGFHPEFTGRQNIRLSAALAGLDPGEVADLSEQIIDFSGLGSFIDEPVKRYSSGMVVRLGFAIATQSNPDVLIVDEALSVGDGRFQKKCFDRIESFVAGGGTLLFCSHALYYVSSLCEEALWLRNGEVAAHGGAAEVAAEYEAYLRLESPGASRTVAESMEPEASEARITGVRMLTGDGDPGEPARHEIGQRWGLEIACESTADVRLHVGVGVNTVDEREIFGCATHRDGVDPLTGLGSHVARVWLPELPLLSGEFTIHVYLLDGRGLHVYDRRSLYRAFRVDSAVYSPALIDPQHMWEVEHGLPLGRDVGS
jgi:lipopolysaccharide transport system ATP-binding protein